MWTLSEASKKNLKGVHPDLIKFVEALLEKAPYDFKVTEGIRTLERQVQLVKERKSRTMNSRHLTGHAIDIAVIKDGKLSWDFTLYEEFADVAKQVALDLGINIIWGGDWPLFRDGPHYELRR